MSACDAREQEFSSNRQLFLTEQGYRYTIDDAEEQGLLVERRAPTRLPAAGERASRSRAGRRA